MPLGFASAVALTLAVEVPVVFLLLRSERKLQAWKIILVAALASLLTLPFVWFAFPLLPLPYVAWLALAEIFAFSAEAALYKLAFRITLQKAALASLVANLLSFCAGLALNRLI
jgi:hypothetical protein